MTADRRRWLLRAAVATAYAGLAAALTWPLAASPASQVPLGTETVSSVPVLNVWTVWWNADRARYGFTDYWHAPIFHPARYAFAFSEAQPTTLVAAPLVALGGPALAYNAYLLGVLALNGIAGYGLLRRVGLAAVPAFLGGAACETLPFIHWQLGVLQLTTLCGVLWVLDRLVAFRDRPGLATAALLGAAAAVCYAACNYWGLYLSALLPVSLAPLAWGRWKSLRFWVLLAASGLLAGLLTAPILWAQWRAKKEYDWQRSEALLVDLSAEPRDYLTTPWRPAFPALEPRGLMDRSRFLWMLGTGPLAVLLAAGGIAAGLLTRGRRRWTLFLLLFGAWAFLFSLGPRLDVLEWNDWRMRADPNAAVLGLVPYRFLTKFHPGLALARSPFRFAFFVQIALVLLGANLLDGLWAGVRRLTRDWRPGRRRFAVVPVSAVVVAAGALAAVEVWPSRQRLASFPGQRLFELPPLDQAWIVWLRDHSDPSRPIVDLPFPSGTGVADYERTALFMYEQIGHRRPMVQGYSGFFPTDFLNLRERMASFPDDELLDDLWTRGVRHVVATTPEWIAKAERSVRLDLVFRDEDARVSVYSLVPSSAADAGP